jgi:hypothetical protein
MSLKLNTASGGSITLQEADTASNLTITVPAVTGTMAIQGPAFSAYPSTVQNLSNGVNTKIAMNLEEFDTNNNYDAVTNYRFTPTVAGYYQVSGSIGLAVISTSISVIPIIYKNGSAFKQGTTAVSSSTSYPFANVSALIYMNGTTDYLEFYGLSTGGTVSSWSAAASNNYFQAALVRSA